MPMFFHVQCYRVCTNSHANLKPSIVFKRSGVRYCSVTNSCRLHWEFCTLSWCLWKTNTTLHGPPFHIPCLIVCAKHQNTKPTKSSKGKQNVTDCYVTHENIRMSEYWHNSSFNALVIQKHIKVSKASSTWKTQ